MTRVRICLLALTALAAFAGAEWHLRSCLETSGGDSTQLPQVVLRTAAQEPAVGVSTGGSYVLRSGFLAAPPVPAPQSQGDVWTIR